MLSRNDYTIERVGPEDEGGGKQSVIAAGALRKKDFPPMRYVVPGFVPEGCTLLAGRPKIGKSWLVLDIACAVGNGGSCLGVPCEHGDVLYLALEDNQRRLRDRLDKVFGILTDDTNLTLDFATEWPRANEGGLEAIRDWIIAARNPRLVIVDTLMMFRPARGDRETLYEGDYNAISGLQGLASEFGIAVIVVHHTRKSGGEFDPFEKVSGTLGLSGAADAAIVLDRDGNGATLYGRGRDLVEYERAISFSKDACRWSVLGEAADVRRTDERSIILDTLKDAEEPMSPGEIADAIAVSRNNVKQLLFKMAKSGEVRKAGARGRYIHPERRDLDNRENPDNRDNQVTSGAEDEGDA